MSSSIRVRQRRAKTVHGTTVPEGRSAVTSAEWSSPADADEVAPAQSVAAVPAAPQGDRQPPRQAAPAPAPVVADLADLGTLDERPLAEHADVFGRVHAQLQAALAEVDGS
jgi:hypothetical protein